MTDRLQDPQATAVDSDLRLVHALMQKRPEALETLYDRYSGKVYAVCLRVMRNPADAEELLTDVFWDLWTKPERYDPERAGLGAYLAVMARSRALDQVRGHSRRARIRAEPGATETIGEILHTAAGQAESPDAQAVAAQERTIVEEALKHLSETQKQALEMSFFEGLSHQQIADRTGAPLGTVKGRIRQGLLQVRQSLTRHYGETT